MRVLKFWVMSATLVVTASLAVQSVRAARGPHQPDSENRCRAANWQARSRQEGRGSRGRQHARDDPADDRSGLQLRRARLSGIRNLEISDRHPRQKRLHDRIQRGRHADRLGATWGTGKPIIALGSDIDDIPQASQKPGVAYHDPLVAGAPGHGEGHNTGLPLQITAALAVKKIMEREGLSGTLKIWPGVAEELAGGKAYFVRAGVFKDVDICLFAHVSDTVSVRWGDAGASTVAVSIEYTFTGESAHAALGPWRGRSALDAVELMDIGWNFRREHLRLNQRSLACLTATCAGATRSIEA